MTTKIRHLIVLFTFFAVGACASTPITPDLKVYEKEEGYRYKTVEMRSAEKDDIMIILAFSGGGTRAAAFSYGLMEALHDIRYGQENRRLLDEVDVISSVSGGSFTAAYYALFPQRFFTDYQETFLERNVQGDLFKGLLWPPNWFRLASPHYDRIDMAADYYDRTIFESKKFKDLLKNPRKPFIILNATDMSLGRRFEFTQDQFDLLCADLSEIPVARAVAASSAFPGLLNPITFENHAQKCREDPQRNFIPPSWINNALDRNKTSDNRRYFNAQDMSSYYQDPERKWIHLMDGGLADNIGLRGPFQRLL
jgi:predicted acylesterase/phospholipase RssA